MACDHLFIRDGRILRCAYCGAVELLPVSYADDPATELLRERKLRMFFERACRELEKQLAEAKSKRRKCDER